MKRFQYRWPSCHIQHSPALLTLLSSLLLGSSVFQFSRTPTPSITIHPMNHCTFHKPTCLIVLCARDFLSAPADRTRCLSTHDLGRSVGCSSYSSIAIGYKYIVSVRSSRPCTSYIRYSCLTTLCPIALGYIKGLFPGESLSFIIHMHELPFDHI